MGFTLWKQRRQFGPVHGYDIGDIYLLFAIVAFGYGLGFMFAANTGANLAYLISQGRLDYYLVLPRNLLLHVTMGSARYLSQQMSNTVLTFSL